MKNPHIQFVVCLLVAAPVTAIAGVSLGAHWISTGLCLSGLLTALSAHRSFRHLRKEQKGERWSGLQMRMLALTGIMAVVGTVLAVGAVLANWI